MMEEEFTSMRTVDDGRTSAANALNSLRSE